MTTTLTRSVTTSRPPRMGAGHRRRPSLGRVLAWVAMILVIVVPPLALHFVLGLPIVFLLVELFETRTPARLREFVAARWVQC